MLPSCLSVRESRPRDDFEILERLSRDGDKGGPGDDVVALEVGVTGESGRASGSLVVRWSSRVVAAVDAGVCVGAKAGV